MNRSEIVALANQARTNPRVARGAFKKLAMAEGYTGASGGWIYYRDSRTAVAQGWQGLADLVGRGMLRFTLAEVRDEQDRRVAEAEAQLEAADAEAEAVEAPATTVVEHTDARDVQPGDIVTIKPLNGAAYRMHVVTNTPGAWEQIPLLCGVVITRDGSAHKTRNRYPLNTDERDASETVVGRRVEIGLKKPVAPTELVKVERPAATPALCYCGQRGRVCVQHQGSKPRKMQGRKLNELQRRAVDFAETNGSVRPSDGFTLGTIVALMDRGYLREADPHHGRRHYLTTTPAQVWDKAHAENAERTPARQWCGNRALHAAHGACNGKATMADFRAALQRDGVDTAGMSDAQVTRKMDDRVTGGVRPQARIIDDAYEEALRADTLMHDADALHRFVRTAFPAVDRYRTPRAEQVKLMWKLVHQGVELPEVDEGWGQPDGMLGVTEAERAARQADSAEYQRSLVRDLGLKTSGRAASRYASPVGGMAMLGPELPGMRADAAYYASKADTPAEKITGVSDRTAAALTSVAWLIRETTDPIAMQHLRIIEAALGATKATHIVGGVELPAGMDWATYERLMGQ